MSTTRRPVASSSTPVTSRNRTISSTREGASQLPTPSPRVRTHSTRGTSSLASSPNARTTLTRGATSLAPPLDTSVSKIRSKSPARAVNSPPLSLVDPKSPLSIREAIALKRAETKKAQQGVKVLKHQPSVGNVQGKGNMDDEVEFSRWSIRDSIERARSSGILNLSSRSLASPPIALFETHLGITPEPLKVAPKETEEDLCLGKTKNRDQTAWFEAMDLTVLKLRDNVIVEIQPEISLFGSLKTLDLRNNRLAALPDTLGDLINLVLLDLSSNQLTSLPSDIGTLPLLTILDVSSNKLTTLPLSVSSSAASPPSSSNSFFAPPIIARASKPLPCLRKLLAAENKLVAQDIPTDSLPSDLTICDLGNNPLGVAKALVHGLSQLTRLKELKLEGTDVTDDSFSSVRGFSGLEVLDLGRTQVTEKVGEIFKGRSVSWGGEEVEGGVRVILGSGVKKETWEIEAERRTRRRLNSGFKSSHLESSNASNGSISQLVDEPARESWEIDAEQGLLTEGGRRRARAAAAHASNVALLPTCDTLLSSRSSSSASHDSSSTPALTQYYDSTLAALTLPPSLPRAHTRARSLAPLVSDGSDPTVPAPALPLPIILAQPFARSLRVLVLSNRRLDPSFVLPMNILDSVSLLPVIEELRLDGCSLGDSVSVLQESMSTSSRKEAIFGMLASLFPSLTSLDLSNNKLTSLSGVRALLIPDPACQTKGLKALKVRGNKISDLAGLEAVAQVLKSEGQVGGWRLEELDLRDNEIAKLPPMLGYLNLDVLLVEGNIFRVPARRVWEREGTKGLLSWLKDRVE